MISFQCSKCKKVYTVKDEFGGKKTTCRICSALIVVPLEEQPVPVPLEVHPRVPVLLEEHPPVPVPLEVHLRVPVSTRACPFCDSKISVSAKKCKHCGETVDVALRAAEEALRQSNRRDSASGSQQQVVIQQGGGRNYVPFPRHILHLVLTLLTCGIWLPVWIIDALCWNPYK